VRRSASFDVLSSAFDVLVRRSVHLLRDLQSIACTDTARGRSFEADFVSR
jgi:hypothetical protein